MLLLSKKMINPKWEHVFYCSNPSALMPSILRSRRAQYACLWGKVVSDGGKQTIHKPRLMQNTGCTILKIEEYA